MTAEVATTTKSGFAFHVHHDVLIEWCTDYDERVRYIKDRKPAGEQEIRLRLFRLIPQDRLPSSLLKAGAAYDKARAAYDKAGEAYDKARAAYDKAGEAYDKAGEAYDKAWEAYDKAWEAKDEARAAYEPELLKLHEELCPDCPWENNTIFGGKS